MVVRRSKAPPSTYAYIVSVRRIMGVETEYGVSVPGQPNTNQMLASSLVSTPTRTERPAAAAAPDWDFEEESPLRDARGFELPREPVVDPGAQANDDDLGLANVILTNGARAVRGPCAPGVLDARGDEPARRRPLGQVRRAGDGGGARRALAVPGTMPVHLYKNNTDNKGVSYGCHENYLMAGRRRSGDRPPPRRRSSSRDSHLRGGPGRHRRRTGGGGFQISQRADFFEVEVGLETTLKTTHHQHPDEPHADPEKYRRLHVIIGDANMSEISTYLKVGTTSLVLAMIEDSWLGGDLAIDAPSAPCAPCRTTRP
jgi:proteasome accessory factor A